MKSHKKRSWLQLGPPKRLLEDKDDMDVEIKGPLFPRPVFHALLGAFCISLMLTMDWIGLLLLNSQGVLSQIGALNTLRVIGALMAGIAVPSALLMVHYRRIYSYTSEGNVFFAITFSISFLLGVPCGLTGIFG